MVGQSQLHVLHLLVQSVRLLDHTDLHRCMHGMCIHARVHTYMCMVCMWAWAYMHLTY